MLKKNSIGDAINNYCCFFATAANADTRVAQATATWQATAIKDTTSMLVVTPLKRSDF